MMNSIIKNKNFQKYTIYILSILSIYIISIIVSSTYNNELILPNPNTIIVSFFRLLSLGETYIYIFNTIGALLLTLSLSFFIGFVLGVFAGIFKYVRYFLKPWMTIMRSLPLATIIVLIMVAIGLKLTPYVIVSLILIPIIYEGILNSIISINKEYLDIYRLSSNLNFRVIIKVYIPLIFSGIKAAFIQAVGLGIKSLIMAEFIVGKPNTLGYSIVPCISDVDYTMGYAYCIIIVIVVLIIETLPKACFKLFNYLKYRNVKKSNKISL